MGFKIEKRCHELLSQFSNRVHEFMLEKTSKFLKKEKKSREREREKSMLKLFEMSNN